eukprot:CAMPEP_0184304214 /NCGR_PEP_ID=MMETSP1049-20130417/13795_1 /TAXON_ID=77928 /ORGANISM="Proteomonas sulcata, Strain CCMP704" /LENGTH=132 /DNA_ID=CAMNT_0026615971 /DNA_START=70 /DNA_END=468 /DNA_ORIENTATION=-
MPRLSSILLLLRDVPKSAKFFKEGLGLEVKEFNHAFAEVKAGETVIALKAADSEAACTTGYTPLLQFDVEDMDMIIPQCLSMGANLDGPIKYPSHGKVASLRSPCGHMIGLFEPNLEYLAMKQAFEDFQRNG